MKVVVIGAGALGGQFAAHLARSGTDVTIVDTWPEHVAAIRSDGLRVSGAFGDHRVEVPAFTDVAAATGGGLFDAAFVHVDANNTAAAGAAAREALKPAGFALQIQNGLGNVEALQEALGADRVIGGSTMNSAALLGPGQPAITHHGPTSFGEWDGTVTPRLEAVAALFQRAGYDTLVDTDIQSKIWTKAVSPAAAPPWRLPSEASAKLPQILNAAINPLCAATGLRLGEMARTPEMNSLQDRVLEELFAVVSAEGVDTIDTPDLTRQIKEHSMSKFSRPSMMQAVDAGKLTEIDALNGHFVKLGQAHGLAMPFNEAVVAFVKGVERTALTRRQHPQSADQAWYDEWEQKEAAEGRAGASPMLSNDYSRSNKL